VLDEGGKTAPRPRYQLSDFKPRLTSDNPRRTTLGVPQPAATIAVGRMLGLRLRTRRRGVMMFSHVVLASCIDIANFNLHISIAELTVNDLTLH